MRELCPASEDEMIAEFLRQEFASYERYGAIIEPCLDRVGVSPEVITHPDLANQDQNRARRDVLGCYRGYGQPGPSFFTGFPTTGVRWSWVTLDPGEVVATRFIRYWAEIWGSSRCPRDLARRIRGGDVPDWAVAQGTVERIRDLAESIAIGQPLPPLILVSADDGETRVAMEGSTRLTAYALAEDALPAEITVLLGSSPGIAGWDEY